jgi:hypothetical protein
LYHRIGWWYYTYGCCCGYQVSLLDFAIWTWCV